jgi:hypothetical protein
MLAAVSPIWAEDAGTSDLKAELKTDNHIKMVGLTVGELFSKFGAPQKVYPVRGQELWQDDVVFVYKDFDCYVFEDHVWQVGVKTAFGVKLGDTRADTKEILDGHIYDFDDCLLLRLPAKGWEMMLRLNFDEAEKVRAIFIYRSDM